MTLEIILVRLCETLIAFWTTQQELSMRWDCYAMEVDIWKRSQGNLHFAFYQHDEKDNTMNYVMRFELPSPGSSWCHPSVRKLSNWFDFFVQVNSE